ncbi:hypothetical protein N7513_002898 [Penicillium frequentans]|nr:hypothetical protein N7513_002898 [Penicillium glabrum]
MTLRFAMRHSFTIPTIRSVKRDWYGDNLAGNLEKGHVSEKEVEVPQSVQRRNISIMNQIADVETAS